MSYTLLCLADPAKPDSNSPPALTGAALSLSSSPKRESSLLRLPTPPCSDIPIWVCQNTSTAHIFTGVFGLLQFPPQPLRDTFFINPWLTPGPRLNIKNTSPES